MAESAGTGLRAPDSAVNFYTIPLACIGLIFLIAKAVSLVRLVFSLFVIPGIPVRPLSVS